MRSRRKLSRVNINMRTTKVQVALETVKSKNSLELHRSQSLVKLTIEFYKMFNKPKE